MAKRKRNLKETGPVEKSRIPLVAAIAGVYYLTLVILVGVTLKFDILLYHGDVEVIPTAWLLMIQAYYYIVPFVLAVVFGLIFRPFWPNARNLLVTFLVIHGLYSFAVFALRSDYFQQQRAKTHKAKLSRLAVNKVKRDFQDKNQDGLVDKIAFLVEVNVEDFPNGYYNIFATITQNGQPLPDGAIGFHEFAKDDNTLPGKKIRFFANPQDYEYFFERGEFELNLGIEKLISADDYGQLLLNLSRWSPFLRTTDWDGVDPEFYLNIEELDYLAKIDSFKLLPINIERTPFQFVDFIEDFGRDLNGDGRFDQLVITFEVASNYEGPIYVQALIAGAPYPLFYESYLEKGVNFLEYVIDAEHLQEINFDGPYELVDFHISTQNPECTAGECEVTGPSYRAFFDNYITYKYSLSQFN